MKLEKRWPILSKRSAPNAMIEKGQAFKKIVVQSYMSSPWIWRVGLCVLVGTFFNITTWPYMKFGLEGATEASFFWVDEGWHIETLERIQETQSLQLIHPAYTAFYPNLSYLMAWTIEGGHPISAKAFAWGSKWVSLVSLNLHLLLAFFWCYTAFSSFGWAFFGLVLLATQRFNLLFATRMHPEGLMLLFTIAALYAGWLFLLKGKSRYLWGLAIATGFAIGTKLQMVFLLPWGGVLFLFTLWKFHIYSPQRILVWVVIGGGLFVLSFFVASPYQMIHFSELLQGIAAESQTITDYYQGQYSAWKWVSQVTSGLHLGPFFSTLFLLSLLMGGKRLIGGWKQQGALILNSPKEMLFLIHVSWIILGAGYIVITYKVFTDRYLIHIHASFILSILLGLHWWVKEKRPFYNWGVKGLIVLLLFGGIQGQWRHTRRDIERRERIHALMESHRRFEQDLIKRIPFDAHILHTIRVYISRKLYPHAQDFFGDISSQILKEDYWDYLIVNNRYRPGMRSVPMRGSQQDTANAVAFWKSLEKDGVQGQFSVVAHYPEIDVTIYRKLKKIKK